MATLRVNPILSAQLSLTRLASFPGMRVLTWQGRHLLASRGYELLRADPASSTIDWQTVGRYRPTWWRNLTASSRLSSRLFRDGFHALAALPSGELIAAVPKAIVTLTPGDNEFRVTHPVSRGTRPLHIAVTPQGHAFWGEYFDNRTRDQVHVYASTDRGNHWEVAYTFPPGTIRHVHNIVYDRWQNCLWVLTGDNGFECRILRTSCDFRHVETVLSGNQQARAVALVPTEDALYFSSDTPFEANHVYRLDRFGNLVRIAELSGSSIYGCRVENAVFFSTMVEPSAVNLEQNVGLYGSGNGDSWQRLLRWRKDNWPAGLFQYGNAVLPDGDNDTQILALTTAAVRSGDAKASLWLVNLV